MKTYFAVVMAFSLMVVVAKAQGDYSLEVIDEATTNVSSSDDDYYDTQRNEHAFLCMTTVITVLFLSDQIHLTAKENYCLK